MFTYPFEDHECEASEATFGTKDGKWQIIKETKPQLIYADGHVEYDLVDNAFDYAGTHCTHGQGGTHDPGASVEVSKVVITSARADGCECDWHDIHEEALKAQYQEQHQEALVEYAFRYIQDEKADRDYDNYKERQDEG